MGKVKALLIVGLEAGVNDAKVDGKNTVEKGPATDPLKEDGKINIQNYKDYLDGNFEVYEYDSYQEHHL